MSPVMHRRVPSKVKQRRPRHGPRRFSFATSGLALKNEARSPAMTFVVTGRRSATGVAAAARSALMIALAARTAKINASQQRARLSSSELLRTGSRSRANKHSPRYRPSPADSRVEKDMPGAHTSPHAFSNLLRPRRLRSPPDPRERVCARFARGSRARACPGGGVHTAWSARDGNARTASA